MYKITGSGENMKAVSLMRPTALLAIKAKKLMLSCGYTSVEIVVSL